MLNIENDSFRSIIVAGGLTFVILAGLAMNMGEDEAGAEILMEEITGKVLSTSLPTNLPAILSIGLGEGLAGFFGTFFVYFTSGRKRVSNDGTWGISISIIAKSKSLRSLADQLLDETIAIANADLLSVGVNDNFLGEKEV